MRGGFKRAWQEACAQVSPAGPTARRETEIRRVLKSMPSPSGGLATKVRRLARRGVRNAVERTCGCEDGQFTVDAGRWYLPWDSPARGRAKRDRNAEVFFCDHCRVSGARQLLSHSEVDGVVFCGRIARRGLCVGLLVMALAPWPWSAISTRYATFLNSSASEVELPGFKCCVVASPWPSTAPSTCNFQLRALWYVRSW